MIYSTEEASKDELFAKGGGSLLEEVYTVLFPLELVAQLLNACFACL